MGSDEAKRRFYKNWYNSKKKAFTKNGKKWADDEEGQEAKFNKIKKYASVVRLIAHTQMKLLPLKQKKAHLIELQVNGGDIAEKVDFARGLFEKSIPVSSFTADDQNVDCIGVTKGKGRKGVTSRWGTKKLPRKSHVSVLGILLVFLLLLPEVVRKVTTTVLRSTKKFTDLALVTKLKTVRSTKTTPLLKLTGLKNLSTLSAASHTTVRSRMT